MESKPQGIKNNPFGSWLDGIFGNFQTNKSYRLNYLLTSMPAKKIVDKVMVASEVFDFKDIDFEVLMQRDIDHERVNTDIKRYLREGEDRVIFFPPLLIAPVIQDANNKIKEKYDDVVSESGEDAGGNKVEYVTWDKNKFQMVFEVTDSTDESKVGYFEIKGKKTRFFKSTAQFRYDQDVVKLVVIDGQHRFAAIKGIIKQGESVLDNVDVPICLFFPPSPNTRPEDTESIVKDLRKIFVDVNKNAKQVSGHFLVLLDDKKLSTICLRQLAQKWKEEDKLDLLKTKLHHLDWNQREVEKGNQRDPKKPYAITTVSVVATCLANRMFNGNSNRINYTKLLLNLSEIETKLKIKNKPTSIDDISEEKFDVEQKALLETQIEKYITPSLDLIFSKPRPYKEKIEKYRKSTEDLDADVSRDDKNALEYREHYLKEFKSLPVGFDDNEYPLLLQTEEKFIEKNTEDDDDYFFFTNVFQHGLLISWINLYAKIFNENPVSPYFVAEALISACEKLCFDKSVKYFSFESSYTQNVLFRGESIIATDGARVSISNLIIGSMINDKVKAEFLNNLKTKMKLDEEVEKKLDQLAKLALGQYVYAVRKNFNEKTKKQWVWMGLDAKTRAKLMELKTKSEADKSDKEKKKAYLEKISEVAESEITGAIKKLGKTLGLDKEKLLEYENLEEEVEEEVVEGE